MPVSEIVAAVFAILAFAAWLSGFIHWIALFPYRKPEISASRLFLSGYLAYSPSTYTPEGQHLHRRFLASLGAFFLCGLCAAMIATISRP